MSLMKASAMPNDILLGQGHVAQQLNKLATMASERWGGDDSRGQASEGTAAAKQCFGLL